MKDIIEKLKSKVSEIKISQSKSNEFDYPIDGKLEEKEKILTKSQAKNKIAKEFGLKGAIVKAIEMGNIPFYIIKGQLPNIPEILHLTRTLEVCINACTGLVAYVDVHTRIEAKSVGGSGKKMPFAEIYGFSGSYAENFKLGF